MIYRFDDFELDDEHFELRCRNEVRALPRKGFDLLRHLLAHAGRVVSKEEIFESIWPALSVSENVLPVTIRTVRRALGDHDGSVLRTVRGRGYMIVSPVVEGNESDWEAEPAESPVGSGFVGQKQLLEKLQIEFASAVDADGRGVLLQGETGMGKTLVLDEFARWARRHTPFVFLAACCADAGAPAYAPLADLARAVEKRLDQLDPIVSDAIDLVRARTDLTDLLDPKLNRELSAVEVRFRYSRTFLRLIHRLCAAQPVVILLDDVHRADEDTLQVLTAIIREIAALRVLIVGSYSEDQLSRGKETSHLLATIAQSAQVEQIAIRGLDPEAVARFVQSEAKLEPSRELVAMLHERTEGNPFFLRETLRWLLQDGQLRKGGSSPADLGLPETVRELILRRLAGLSEDCNYVLSWAAVAGKSFTVPLLEQVTGLASDEVLRQLGAAEDARIISSRDASGVLRSPGEYGFAHGLVAETLYQSVPEEARVRRHLAVAEALEALSGRSSGDRLEELAHHFFLAASAGEIDRATRYAAQAAERALRLFSPEDAIRHQRNRLAAEELRYPIDEVRRCEALLGLGEALGRAGQYAEADHIYLEAVDGARKLEDPALLALAALGVSRDPFRVGSVGPETSGPNAGEGTLELLEEAAAILEREDVDATLRSRVLAALARRVPFDRPRSLGLAERAVTLARGAQSRVALFDALMAQLATSQGPDQVARSLDLASEAVDLAKNLDVPPRLFQAYAARIPLWFTLGEMSAADRDIKAVELLASRLRISTYAYTAARFEMCRAAGSGNFERAKGLLERVMRLGRRAGDPAIGWIAGGIGLFLMSSHGNSSAAGATLEMLTSAKYMEGPSADAFAAHYFMVMRDRKQCAERLEQAVGSGIEHFPRSEDWLWNLSILADVCTYLDDTERSAELYALLAPYEHLNVVNRLWYYRGSLATVLGRLAMTLGDLDAARAHLEYGTAFNRKIGARVSVLFTQLIYVSLLERGSSKDRREARLLQKELASEASRLGLTSFIERMRDVV